ncbi:uncharacterized protein TNCV_2975091 [Trichonephila clavipes]|nr:uncharacterized protein TNCV_2975091 [Trichonephila clavipes]
MACICIFLWRRVLCCLLRCSSPPGGAIAYQLLHSSINCQFDYRQHFAMFPLNRRYNLRNCVAYEYYNFNRITTERYLSTTENMPRRRIRAHYEQLSEFERGRMTGLKEAGLGNRRIARHMGRSDVAIRRCWQEWVDSPRFQHNDGSG